MTPTLTSIDRLKQSVAGLMSKARALERERARLEGLCGRQEAEIAQLKAKVCELEGALTHTLLSRSFVEVSGGVKGAKARINGLIRDIDKCISLIDK